MPLPSMSSSTRSYRNETFCSVTVQMVIILFWTEGICCPVEKHQIEVIAIKPVKSFREHKIRLRPLMYISQTLHSWTKINKSCRNNC